MRVDVAVTVGAPSEAVWSVVSDIEGATTTLSAVEEIEVVENPGEGLLGFKWRETRTIFGKRATETMWITEVEDGVGYVTEARSHGSIYRTRVRVDEEPGGTRLSMTFAAQPVSLGAKVLSTLLGFVMKRSVRSALLKDLRDIKAAVESRQR
ncbi:MAG TPA: SRPBCC family protein [Gemmatimonadota bacterium]|nr:SRPBCC family protein [Gemmatimonadota bacterium]